VGFDFVIDARTLILSWRSNEAIMVLDQSLITEPSPLFREG
jgi:hypothetical protein